MARSAWPAVLVASGAAALAYEAVWIRRLTLLLGASAIASAVTVGAFMAGLALGGALSTRLGRVRPATGYAALEAAAAGWALAFPWLFEAGRALAVAAPGARWIVAAGLLVPPATALGATWPLLARTAGGTAGALLYASNTGGAVLGVLLATFAAMPILGVRGTEVAAAVVGLGAAASAVWIGGDGEPEEAGGAVPIRVQVAAGLVGFAAMGLEVLWMRLAAVALGATVQTFGFVLATFLATVAAGAFVGRTWPADPRLGLAGGAAALGGLALLGGLAWGALPFLVAAIWRVGGADALLPGAAAVAAVAMGGAPLASGLAFSGAVRILGPRPGSAAGRLYAANAVGSTAGAVLGGLVAVPLLEVRGALWLFAGVAALAGAVAARRAWPLAPALLAPMVPAWDARLYAVGVHLRISEFADPSSAAVRAFADEGWDLLAYDHGATGAVAVGRSRRTGNVWLSINGKVDASTGDDMPTQLLSGQLPVRLAADPRDVLVVGLASGVTAGAALAEPGVERLVVAEIEPAVVRAERFFRHANGDPLSDPRTALVVDDARAWLLRTDQRFDVVISEPSNPWITGVSSLFTREYHELVRDRLRPGGVACQWIQLYGMGPDELRGLLRTFLAVFPDALLFETVEGADVVLIGGAPVRPGDLPVEPLLDGEGLRRVAGTGWLHTDDRPIVEWRAPRWLHRATGVENAALLRSASHR